MPTPASQWRRGLTGHRIHDDIDAELRVVLTLEALVPPVVIPLAAVILVRIQHAEAAVVLDAAQVLVHEIIAPPVELVGGLRRPVRELEERSIERVRPGDLVERV